jgi:hypothetical protein
MSRAVPACCWDANFRELQTQNDVTYLAREGPPTVEMEAASRKPIWPVRINLSKCHNQRQPTLINNARVVSSVVQFVKTQGGICKVQYPHATHNMIVRRISYPSHAFTVSGIGAHQESWGVAADARQIFQHDGEGNETGRIMESSQRGVYYAPYIGGHQFNDAPTLWW